MYKISFKTCLKMEQYIILQNFSLLLYYITFFVSF